MTTIVPRYQAGLRSLLLDKIDRREASRDWRGLPADYEATAIKQMRDYLREYVRGNGYIKERVALGRADSWDDLRAVVSSLSYSEPIE